MVSYMVNVLSGGPGGGKKVCDRSRPRAARANDEDDHSCSVLMPIEGCCQRELDALLWRPLRPSHTRIQTVKRVDIKASAPWSERP